MKKRTILVDGKKVKLELRICANPGCDSKFWAKHSSEQSICGTSCWEMTYHKIWLRNTKMPKIVRPGDKKRKKQKVKGPKYSMRAITDQSWKAAELKRRVAAKDRTSLGSLPLACKTS